MCINAVRIYRLIAAVLFFSIICFSSSVRASDPIHTKPIIVGWDISSAYKAQKTYRAGIFKTFEDFKSLSNSEWTDSFNQCRTTALANEAVACAANSSNCGYVSGCQKITFTGLTPERFEPITGEPSRYIILGSSTWAGSPNPPANSVLNDSTNLATPIYGCPEGSSFSWDLGYKTCAKNKEDQTPPNSCATNSPSPLVGHPINAATGNKERFETDYESADGVLKIERHYLNQFAGWQSNSLSKLQDFRVPDAPKSCQYTGIIKYTAYDIALNAQREFIESVCLQYVTDSTSNYRVYITLPNGFVARFRETATNIFSPDNALIGKLRALDPATNNNASWEYTAQDNTKQLFDQSGLLIAVVNANGRKINYQYTNFILSRATDDAGRSLNYNYDTSGNVSNITLPDGSAIVYTYQDTPVKGTLSKVTFPDGSFKSFFYNEATYIDPTTPFAMRALTHQTDELGNTLGAYHYDSSGKAISTEAALGLDKFSLSGFGANTSITDPLGSTRSMAFTALADGTKVVSSQSQPAGSGCAASTKNLSYSTNGLVSSKTEFNGNTTLYGYNAANLEDRRVEGTRDWPDTSLLNTAAVLPAGARKISTEWHPSWRKATRIAEPKKITTTVYHGQPDPFAGGTANCAPASVTAALVCKKVEQATTDANGASGFAATLDTTLPKREWRYTYNELGKPLTVITPHNILTSTTESRYEYYSADGTNWKKGDLKQVTNALGHITQYIAYDLNGRLLELVDANAVHQKFTYDLRGRLLTSEVGTDKTSLTYDAAGNLKKVVAPNGAEINNTYDAAHRLINVSDKLGNHMDYTLDNAGNRTNTVISDLNGVLRFQQQQVYDALSRVQKIAKTDNTGTTYLYDANGNPTGEVDAKQQTTSHQFDALDQLKQTTDALNGKTDLGYDSQGHITSVKDPKGNSTIYNYNAFGDLVSQVSPDTGTTTFTYDAAGNRTSAKDARNIVVNYTYDALGRLKTVTYPAATTENITYTYDGIANGSYGLGRLASVATAAARNDYEYNAKGLISKKFTQVGSLLSTTQYTYDAAGQLSSILYPSGRSVTYVRDTQGRIQSISTKADANATAQTIATSINYLPFGPVSSYSYGNGLTHTNSFDTDYRLTKIQVGTVLSRSYGYDATDNINAITDLVTSTKNQAFGYDALDRLTSATGVYGSLGYTYDAVGNRLTEKVGSATSTYNYETTSNRLQNITGASTRSFTYDAAGNRTVGTTEANTTQTTTYNNANRLATAKVGTTLVGTYAYNALGQRISKVAGTTKEYYHYDEAGQLIAVTDATGKATREYIYNGDQLLGFITVAYPAIPSISLTSSKATFQGSAALEKIQTGYTGTVGYVHFSGEGQANWPLVITTTASYSATLRYSLTGTDRPLALLIDGVQKATVNFPATANLNTWGSARVTVTLALTAGNHTLTLKTTGSGGPNIDTVGIGAVSGQTAAPVSTLYYVHNDHHNTPQVATNQAKAVVWMADYQPFGKLQPGQTNSIELYSRFPGQYVDAETGLYYNYFRDYDPSIGRYIESDPIGLAGGINTYAYVGGNPLSGSDPYGLFCTSTKTTVYCNVPNGPSIHFPRPAGWPDTIKPGDDNYHFYDKSKPYSGNKKCLENQILGKPTPGYPDPALPNGMPNNATPEPWNTVGVQNPVLSYALMYNGQQVIVNVTQPGHHLFPGYVARAVDETTIHNYGEGRGALQSDSAPNWMKNSINDEWYNAINADKDTCGCQN